MDYCPNCKKPIDMVAYVDSVDNEAEYPAFWGVVPARKRGGRDGHFPLQMICYGENYCHFRVKLPVGVTLRNLGRKYLETIASKWQERLVIAREN